MSRATPIQRTAMATRVAIAGLAVVLAAGACSSSDGGASSSGSDSGTAAGAFPVDVQRQLAGVVDAKLKESKIPGAMVLAWTKDATWSYPTGTADLSTGAKVVADEVFPIRSVAKSFTVTLLLQLVDQGKVKLDDPVSTYLPDFRDGDQITVRELANMTSGLPDYTNQKLIDVLQTDPTGHKTPEELLAFSADEPLDFPPGTAYSYSNANTIAVGLVVEKAGGQPYADQLQERILGPLHLTHTQFLEGSETPDPHPLGYAVDEDTGKPEPQPVISYSLLSFAGGIVSTAADLRLWAKALATGSLLKPATQKERLADSRKPTDGPEYDRYGLGIGEIDGWWGHTGNGLGFTAAVLEDPKTGSGVVILLNSNEDNDGPAHIAQKLIPILNGS